MTMRKHRSYKLGSRKLVTRKLGTRTRKLGGGRKLVTRNRKLTAGYSYSKYKRVGGCGCGAKMHGGYTYSSTRRNKQSGGNSCGAVGFGTSFENVPIHTFHPHNSYQTDPNYYSLASRNIPM